MFSRMLLAIATGLSLYVSPVQSSSLHYEEEQNFVAVLYGFYYQFNSATVSLDHATADIDFYKIHFDNLVLPQGGSFNQGVVDRKAIFMGYGSELITDQKTIKKITSSFQQVAAAFNTENLIGYFGKFHKDNLSEVVFVDNKNRYAIRGGELFGNQQYDALTYFASDQHIHQDWATFLYKTIKKTKGFFQGSSSAPKKIYVLGTPNDSETHEFYTQILPYVESGEVKIYWSLYPYLANPQEPGQINAIYDGIVAPPYPPTPQGAWAYNQDNYDEDNQLGAILPIVRASEEARERANSTMIFNFAYNPLDFLFILYKDTEGQAQYVSGLPDDIAAFVNDIQIN